ncbi:unnamed protein product [Penicillium roqueforti FM164]|uniref:Genomic scaffold, ProqFM164S04 n=1 Tax=Penicillium roqueforti (strain FM164) TaxID=1365484 RepID=W6QFF0_PENRF|nr:unnamed protein product [Penicillium roqueforti FM164]
MTISLAPTTTGSTKKPLAQLVWLIFAFTPELPRHVCIGLRRVYPVRHAH